jgi:hypothetical protein
MESSSEESNGWINGQHGRYKPATDYASILHGYLQNLALLLQTL